VDVGSAIAEEQTSGAEALVFPVCGTSELNSPRGVTILIIRLRFNRRGLSAKLRAGSPALRCGKTWRSMVENLSRP
jgi:hypothetical protein